MRSSVVVFFFRYSTMVLFYSCMDLDTLVTLDLLWVFLRQWLHRLEVKRSKPSDLGFPNTNHMCCMLVNDSDKSTLFSLHGSVYMKM